MDGAQFWQLGQSGPNTGYCGTSSKSSSTDHEFQLFLTLSFQIPLPCGGPNNAPPSKEPHTHPWTREHYHPWQREPVNLIKLGLEWKSSDCPDGPLCVIQSQGCWRMPRRPSRIRSCEMKVRGYEEGVIRQRTAGACRSQKR